MKENKIVQNRGPFTVKIRLSWNCALTEKSPQKYRVPTLTRQWDNDLKKILIKSRKWPMGQKTDDHCALSPILDKHMGSSCQTSLKKICQDERL